MIIKKEKFQCLALASNLLLKGELILIPTDTVYGFSGIKRTKTEKRLEQIKMRPKGKNLIYLIENPISALKYVDTSFYKEKELDVLLSNWPSPLTVIFKATKPNSTIALRCPDDEWLRELIYKVGSPIFSTSANISGCPVISNIKKLEETFGESIPLIVDGGELSGKASTIVDASKKPFKVIRKGSYTISF